MPIPSNNPSTSSKTAANLKAELAAMEEEEAAEARRKQEREEKKKKLAELAEARKAEEAAAAAAEAAQKATKKTAKRRVDMQGPDEANKKQKSTDEFDRVEELAQEGCRRCVANSFI